MSRIATFLVGISITLQRILHAVDVVMKRIDGMRIFCQEIGIHEVVVFKIFILESDVSIGNFVALAIERMIFALIVMRFVGAVDAHMIVAAEVTVPVAGVVEAEAVLALGGTFGKDVNAIIPPVNYNFAITALRNIAHIGPCQLKREQVARIAAVLPRSEQTPVVIALLAHVEHHHLCLLGINIGSSERSHRKRFFARIVERRIAAILQCYVSLIIFGLRRVCNGVAVVMSVTIVDDRHIRQYLVFFLYGLSFHIQKNNRQRSLSEPYVA